MKIIVQLIVAILLSFSICNVSDYRPSVATLNTLYTVSGILFSVGLSLVISIKPDGMRNENYIDTIRKSINNVRNHFLVEFFVITFLYICFSSPEMAIMELIKKEEITLKFDLFLYTWAMLIFSIPYIMYGFLSIQKLNNDIFDKVNEETKDNQPHS
ncbi:hypothetical protein [uncultured Haemophilus sp.]|uniref:hypothetical protein n=1 Tax=uncultured Haemophilus sp. TaxID=237779 RepID=UPI0015B527FD|nr:hypothetical protein [uncultured Haemophilus sp.]